MLLLQLPNHRSACIKTTSLMLRISNFIFSTFLTTIIQVSLCARSLHGHDAQIYKETVTHVFWSNSWNHERSAEWEQLIEPNLSQCFLISRSSFLLNTWETVSAVADFRFFSFARHNIQQSPRNEGIAPHQHHRLFLAQSKIFMNIQKNHLTSSHRRHRHPWASWSR